MRGCTGARCAGALRYAETGQHLWLVSYRSDGYGPCGVTFDRVKVRYHPKVVLEVHIDTDEGNACDIETATKLELIK